MKIQYTSRCSRILKKLHVTQKRDLDDALKRLIENPLAGEKKVGNLAQFRVYKFFMTHQLTLLAYHYDEGTHVITLWSIGSHENFYRDLYKSL